LSERLGHTQTKTRLGDISILVRYELNHIRRIISEFLYADNRTRIASMRSVDDAHEIVVFEQDPGQRPMRQEVIVLGVRRLHGA